MLTTALWAQTEMTNITTITIEKKVDGKLRKEVIVIEGDGADEKLKEIEKDKSVVSINVEKRVEMKSEDPNSEEMKNKRKEIEAEIKQMEDITGTKAERREENVEIEITADDTQEVKKYKVKVIENGKEEVIEWDGKGEMPEKMKKVMEDSKVEVKSEGPKQEKQFKIINAKEMGIEDVVIGEENNNRGQIGVMISAAKGGVAITEFPQNSMAEKAGLEVGDIITGVNDQKITTMRSLVSALTPYKPGDVVTIHITRGDSYMKKDVKMAKRQ